MSPPKSISYFLEECHGYVVVVVGAVVVVVVVDVVVVVVVIVVAGVFTVITIFVVVFGCFHLCCQSVGFEGGVTV